MPECGKINGKPAAGCEADNLTSVRMVELDKTLYLSSEGFLTLTYRGPLLVESGECWKHAVRFVTGIVLSVSLHFTLGVIKPPGFNASHLNRLSSSVCFTGKSDTFTVTFFCTDSYPGELKFVREEINSMLNIHDTFFEFHTALACAPAPVDCQITGKYVHGMQVGSVQ